MKTILSSGITGCLVLGLLACSGADGHDNAPGTTPEPSSGPAVEPAPEAPPAPVAANAPGDSASGISAAAPPQQTPETVTPMGLSGAAGTPNAATAAVLDWRPCGQFENRNIECAELDVPIDYAQPDGDQVTLALRRIPASPLDPHHGALLFNPGGPGGYGIDDALQMFEGGWFEEIAPGYDIIGFDPRGVAESGERGCGISEPNLYPGAQTTTTSELSLQDYLDYYRNVGAACQKTWGQLLGKLGSNNVVKDMEQIRKALNEPLLNFYGTSYGTRLGALYAHDYPKTTGRIVLDAPVSPRGSFVEETRDQYYEVLSLNEQIFTACENGTITCTPNARDVFAQAVANATKRGIEHNSQRTGRAYWRTRRGFRACSRPSRPRLPTQAGIGS